MTRYGALQARIRAMDAMRLEKSYRLVPRELSIEYSAYESCLQRFVHPDKGDIVGRDALLKRSEAGENWQLVTMEVHGVKDADARGSEPIYLGDELVGRATSGGYGWRVERSLVLAMAPPKLASIGTELSISILGESYKVTVIEESPFDAGNKRLRG